MGPETRNSRHWNERADIGFWLVKKAGSKREGGVMQGAATTRRRSIGISRANRLENLFYLESRLPPVARLKGRAAGPPAALRGHKSPGARCPAPSLTKRVSRPWTARSLLPLSPGSPAAVSFPPAPTFPARHLRPSHLPGRAAGPPAAAGVHKSPGARCPASLPLGRAPATTRHPSKSRTRRRSLLDPQDTQVKNPCHFLPQPITNHAIRHSS